jgi:hypothetical protein
MQAIELQVPPLGAIMVFRGVHALCSINKATNMLRATHYATCLIGGRSPTWGVWNIEGRFQRFCESKEEVHKAYPYKAWRRCMASWNMTNVAEPKDAHERRGEFKSLYKRGKVLNGTSQPVAALFEDGLILPWESRTMHHGKRMPLYIAAPQEETV